MSHFTGMIKKSLFHQIKTTAQDLPLYKFVEKNNFLSNSKLLSALVFFFLVKYLSISG